MSISEVRKCSSFTPGNSLIDQLLCGGYLLVFIMLTVLVALRCLLIKKAPSHHITHKNKLTMPNKISVCGNMFE